MTAAAPSGVVTFLFTDIEGSTRRWEADAEAMRVRPAGARRGACAPAIEIAQTAFCSATPVTEWCAAFASPRSAVDAADQPHSGHWSCRCGWASRPVKRELRGADYFGAVLNRAARVMAAGHGGQILVADSTAVLLSGVDLARSGTATAAGCADAGRGVSATSARACG